MALYCSVVVCQFSVRLDLLVEPAFGASVPILALSSSRDVFCRLSSPSNTLLYPSPCSQSPIIPLGASQPPSKPSTKQTIPYQTKKRSLTSTPRKPGYALILHFHPRLLMYSLRQPSESGPAHYRHAGTLQLRRERGEDVFCCCLGALEEGRFGRWGEGRHCEVPFLMGGKRDVEIERGG